MRKRVAVFQQAHYPESFEPDVFRHHLDAREALTALTGIASQIPEWRERPTVIT